ncbi:hypothetical protein BJ508DRAFT_310350 [Ascobolus immersus RN42]|uniref:Uncharacterized protein n=1 Tax=Ascobolus immersus RN42 TaxID=1160509 RepID=A0A3N4HZB3_ASCIM|nr:hypothetical protein BJ508DRAFT_310350 [Ascobolus immersus RN42]
MPIKLLKFGRRKSAGNALEAEYEPAAQSPHDPPRQSVSSSSLFSGFGKKGVNTSPSAYDSPNPPFRLSSSSTLPSLETSTSSSSDLHKDHHSRFYNPFHKKAPSKSTMSNEPPTLQTPIESGSMFSSDDMFLSKTHRLSSFEPVTSATQSVSPLPVRSGSPDSYDSINFQDDGERISVKHVNRKQPPTITMKTSHSPTNYDTVDSPRDFGRRQSEEALMAYDSSPRNSRTLTPQVATFSQSHARQDSLTAPVQNYGRRRGSGDHGRRSSQLVRREGVEDEDARIVRQSIRRPDAVSSLAPKKDRDSGWEENIASSANSSVNSLPSKPQALPSPKASEDDDNVFDLTITEKVTYERKQSVRKAPKKMTKAEYDRYIAQKEAEASSSEDSESEEEEEDDSEQERFRELQRQREKQEAHLAVHRQQLMKETGVPGPTAPPYQRASTAPTLSFSAAASVAGGSDEDEDVPLAILQAHGFPNKNRPPARLSNLSTPSLQNLRSAALPVFARGLPQDPYMNGNGLVNQATRMSLGMGIGSGGSVYGGNGGGSVYGGGGGSVYGGGGGSVYGGGSQYGSNVSLYQQMEQVEAMKAARRPGGKVSPYRTGSPQVPGMDKVPSTGVGLLGLGGGSGGFQDPRMSMMAGMQQPMMDPRMSMMGGMPQQQMMDPRMSMMGGSGMGVGSTGGSVVNARELELQMEMLKLQIELEKAKNANNNRSTPNLPPPSRDSLAPPTPQFRPQQGQGQRAMSMVAPSDYGRPMSIAPSINMVPNRATMAGMNGMGLPPPQAPFAGYTPSIAPSERSTVGQPRRYRGVSNIMGSNASQSGRTVTLVSQVPPRMPVGKNGGGSDDEDDWEEAKRRREEKKNKWRGKKDSGLLASLS